MSWSYSGNPGSNPKDTVRFLIGDTNAKDQLLLDGEITWTLGQYNNSPMQAAIKLCDVLIAKYARMVDETVGSVRVSWSQRMDSMKTLQTALRARLSIEDSSFYAGGISQVDKVQQEADTDRVKPDFSKHMMENKQIAPWTTQNFIGRWTWFGDL